MARKVVAKAPMGDNAEKALADITNRLRISIALGDASLQDAEKHYKEAGRCLLEVKEILKSSKEFEEYVRKNTTIKKTQAYLYISLHNGKTSLTEIRNKARVKMEQHRAAKKARGPSYIKTLQSYVSWLESLVKPEELEIARKETGYNPNPAKGKAKAPKNRKNDEAPVGPAVRVEAA